MLNTAGNEIVSLIVPCYNGEKHVDSCMKSILQQMYDKMEIIIINDGLRDESEEKIMRYKISIMDRGYMFKYKYQKNRGAAAAINTALKMVIRKDKKIFL